MDKEQAVMEVAQEELDEQQDDGVYILSTGVAVRVSAVSPSLITKARMRLEYPKVPTFHNDEKDRTEENPNHPDYIAARNRVDEERGLAALDAMCMFGIELVDGVPGSNDWVRRLKFVLPDLDFDEGDELAREFYYKTLVAVSAQDYAVLARAMGVTEEGVAQAEKSFPGNTTRNDNRGRTAQKRRKRRG